MALEDNIEVQYKVDNFYEPLLDRAIRWDDPELNIDWGINIGEIIVSEKDKSAPFLKDSDVNFVLE